jgi:hypothetical protein
VAWRPVGSKPHTITACSCGRKDLTHILDWPSGKRIYYCKECAKDIEEICGLKLTRFVEL